MLLSEIFDKYTKGSPDFIEAVLNAAIYDISYEECARICEASTNPDEFDRIYSNETWWTDAANEQEW